jgi:hypothetical protein
MVYNRFAVNPIELPRWLSVPDGQDALCFLLDKSYSQL